MEQAFSSSAYSDPDVFLQERVAFRKTWHFIGFLHELQQHHDFVCREIGGRSVIVQNFHGKLKAFHNVCSHRFSRIHTECRGNRPLQCPYHGWAYNGEGIPVGIPSRPRFDNLTPERICQLRLQSWQTETCGGMVFVKECLDGQSLRDYLGGAFDVVERCSSSLGMAVDVNEMTIRANWKILVENTLESYHVHFIHPESFNRLGLAAGRFEFNGPHSAWHTQVSNEFQGKCRTLLKLLADRPVQLEGYLHQLVFPNLTIATTFGTSFSIQLFEPMSASETKFTSFVFQTRLPESAVTKASLLEVLASGIRDFNRQVFAEDKEICEQVQAGGRETSQPGILSDEEVRVCAFQNAYAQALTGLTSPRIRAA